MLERTLKRLVEQFFAFIVLYLAYLALKYYLIYFIKIFGWIYELPLRLIGLKYNHKINKYFLISASVIFTSAGVTCLIVGNKMGVIEKRYLYISLIALYLGFITLFSVLTRKISHKTLRLSQKNGIWGLALLIGIKINLSHYVLNLLFLTRAKKLKREVLQ